MKSSLYSQYLKERCGRGTLEGKHGFATFDYISQDVVYIVDLYVIPKKRKSGLARIMADQIVTQAIKDGRKYLLGSVDTTAKGAENSIQVLKAYGMEVYKVTSPLIFFYKQISRFDEKDTSVINDKNVMTQEAA